MDYDNLMKSSIHNKTYWMVATKTAVKASQRKASHGEEAGPSSSTANKDQQGRDLELLMWRKRFSLIAGLAR